MFHTDVVLDEALPLLVEAGITIPMVPEAFGCNIVCSDDQFPWVEPAISHASQIRHLKPAKPGETYFIKRQSAWVDYAQMKLGTDLSLWTMDMQSPFSVATQIMDHQELLTACITNPQEVHCLLRMITDFTVDMMQQHLCQMEHPGFPGRNFPSISANIGLCIADDTPLIMLSPKMYQEFALPYNSELGRTFGGLHVHSCGDYRHNLDNLLQITDIRSIHLHAGPGEFPLPESAAEDCSFNRARNKVTYFIDTNEVSRGDAYRDQWQQHFSEYVLPRVLAGNPAGCILESAGEDDLSEVNAALGWVRHQIAVLSANNR